jgi:hypothetical protein
MQWTEAKIMKTSRDSRSVRKMISVVDNICQPSLVNNWFKGLCLPLIRIVSIP